MRFLVFLLLFIISCQAERTIYNINFVDLKGNPARMEKPVNKKLLLYVWTGTCTGHTDDIKVINENYEKLSQKYEVVSLAVFMTPQDVLKVLKDYGIKPKFKVLVDPKGNITELVKLVFLPSTMIFNEEGELVKEYPRFPLKELISFVEPYYVSLCEDFPVHF